MAEMETGSSATPPKDVMKPSAAPFKFCVRIKALPLSRTVPFT